MLLLIKMIEKRKAPDCLKDKIKALLILYVGHLSTQKKYGSKSIKMTSLIICRDEITKNDINNQKLEHYFQQLQRKIFKKKGDETNKMIIRKF